MSSCKATNAKLVEYVPTVEERGGHAGQVSREGKLTGSFHEVVVSYVTRDPRWCKHGFCVLGLVPFAKCNACGRTWALGAPGARCGIRLSSTDWCGGLLVGGIPR